MIERKGTLILDMPIEQVFDFCLQRLKFSPRFRLQTEDSDNGVIRLVTGISWKTFGDEIILTPVPLSPTHTSIHIVSRTKGFQIVEHGIDV